MQGLVGDRPNVAAHAAPHARPSLMSIVNPLLVHLRLPRENAVANGAEMAAQVRVKEEEPSPRTRPRRRRRDSSDDERDDAAREARGEEATSDSGSSVATARGDTRRRKSRKPTYIVQKEEKETLVRELRELEARAEELRARVGMPSLAVHTDTQQKCNDNRTMERARRDQLLSLCSVQSIFSNYMRDQFSAPLKVPVHLGRDMAARRATLMALRPEKLDLAYRLIQHRLDGVDQRLPLDDSMMWTSEEGDFCFSRTDVSHFEGVRSVKQVFDALNFYIANMEITISEVLGQLTLREDIDCVDTRATNHRLVSSTDHGIVVENNSICFSEYYEAFSGHDGQEFGIFTVDCVDEDDLYPYRPWERVRKNITAAVTLSAYRKPTSGPSVGGTSDGELVVVMCRAAYLTLKRPLFPVSAVALEDLRGTVAAWGRVMNKTVRDHVYSQTAQQL